MDDAAIDLCKSYLIWRPLSATIHEDTTFGIIPQWIKPDSSGEQFYRADLFRGNAQKVNTAALKTIVVLLCK